MAGAAEPSGCLIQLRGRYGGGAGKGRGKKRGGEDQGWRGGEMRASSASARPRSEAGPPQERPRRAAELQQRVVRPRQHGLGLAQGVDLAARMSLRTS
ncbi:unnamed protein product [Prorocentrum cordatum]|uniref:Uncharacterized protein n=1 Tax=Prorocentrum cordatum TaxID=2364126 RepID=A0ABN9YGK7_9DINO|nr:unnamed protein product [Polarella glacialis]